MSLSEKFGACGRCVALASGALGISLYALVASRSRDDAVGQSVALALVALSGAVLILHGVGWTRKQSSRPH